MIVRNEAQHLEACLGPVAALFDEVVVVDTGSSDATREIAARFTPHVHEFAWCDDFSAARNEALRHATGDWVMWLDADDRLRPAEVAKLATLLDSLDREPRIYMMDTVSASQYECEGEWRVAHRRLFRKLPGVAWSGRVHEQLTAGSAVAAFDVINSDIEIEHIGYRDLSAVRRKLQRNIRLLQMDYAVDPNDASTLFHLGVSYSRVGANGEGRKHLLRLLETRSTDPELMRRVFSTLAEIAIAEGRLDQAEATVRRGLAYFPDDDPLLHLLAQVLYEVHRYDEARAALRQIMSGIGSPRLFAGGPGHLRRKLAPRKLGAVLRMQEEFAAAETTLLEVLKEFPDDTHSWYILGLVYIDTSNAPQLAHVIERLNGCPQGRVFGLALLAAWQLGHGQLRESGPVIEQAVATAPDWPLPRLLRAEWLARADAPRGEQERAFRDLLRVQPGNRYAMLRLQHLAAPALPAAAAAVAAPAAAAAWSTTPNDWGTSVIVSAGV